jgi:hypothetical protein
MPTDLTQTTRLVVEKLHSCATSGNFNGELSVIDESVLIHEPPFLPFGGRYEGKDAFGALFERIGQYLDLPRMAIDHTVADGDKAFGVIRIPRPPNRSRGPDRRAVDRAQRAHQRFADLLPRRPIHQRPRSELVPPSSTPASMPSLRAPPDAHARHDHAGASRPSRRRDTSSTDEGLGRPDEVANTIGWPRSDEASHLTGQIIGVEGGLSATG